MYVRDAKNREEVWLLDHIEAMSLDGQAFRSRDYVIAIDEESNAKAGFGRYRVHTTDDGEVCELTSIGVLDGWRGQGVGAHVIERLVTTAGAQGFDLVYALADQPNYLTQFGFEAIERDRLPEVLRKRLDEKRETTTPDAIPLRLQVERFRMPEELRERFKVAAERSEPEPEESPEDFGIDSETATYKYDTGG
ncbi:GNAT family N-acetyltransferase [Halomarina litorea]|uniref:GNAT family N-acetyltransferase n=1 Tax=Halomarina litorea TaxID=2961595 RepID=UPI0020C213DE|nr:GNAT family N-acetyltransferase [Halomarina sp. BCD28]